MCAAASLVLTRSPLTARDGWAFSPSRAFATSSRSQLSEGREPAGGGGTRLSHRAGQGQERSWSRAVVRHEQWRRQAGGSRRPRPGAAHHRRGSALAVKAAIEGLAIKRSALAKERVALIEEREALLYKAARSHAVADGLIATSSKALSGSTQATSNAAPQAVNKALADVAETTTQTPAFARLKRSVNVTCAPEPQRTSADLLRRCRTRGLIERGLFNAKAQRDDRPCARRGTKRRASNSI